MLGFLENPAGLFFFETIEAFKRVGAIQTATILSNIARIMSRYGISFQELRTDLNELSVWAISSFSQSHGENASKMAEEITEEAKGLYLYETENRTEEPVWAMLESFIKEWKDFLSNELPK